MDEPYDNPDPELTHETSSTAESSKLLINCGSTWKMGAPDWKKIVLQCWDQSGFFGGACRHGLIMMFCEMRRSGEL